MLESRVKKARNGRESVRAICYASVDIAGLRSGKRSKPLIDDCRSIMKLLGEQIIARALLPAFGGGVAGGHVNETIWQVRDQLRFLRIGEWIVRNPEPLQTLQRIERGGIHNLIVADVQMLELREP